MFTRRILALVATLIVATFTVITTLGATSGTALAARIEPCQVQHTCPYAP